VTATRENGARNGVADQIEIGRGSVKEIRSNFFNHSKAPLVVANILTPILMRLFDDGMGELVTEDGMLVLSGILDTQRDQIVERAQQAGFRLVDETELTDWIALAFRHG
jgi:ribosomal protein L11 methyltransferase